MNNFWISFDPVFPPWIIVPATLLLFAFFIWKEFGRAQKLIVARVLALTLMGLAILGLFLQPSYRDEKLATEILLLTANYDKAKADSIVKRNPSYKVIRTPDAKPYLNSEVLTSHHDLAK